MKGDTSLCMTLLWRPSSLHSSWYKFYCLQSPANFTNWHPHFALLVAVQPSLQLTWWKLNNYLKKVRFYSVSTCGPSLSKTYSSLYWEHIIENVGDFLLSCLEILHNLLRIRDYSSGFTHLVILKLDAFFLLLFEISSVFFLQMQLNLYVKAVNLSAQMMVS